MSTTQERSLDATYRRHLTDGALVFQRCGDGHAVFPPRPACPSCGSRELAWTESTGDATIYSATTISPRGQDPHTVVILDVDEGFRMMSRLDGPDATAASIGDRVRITVRRITDDDAPLPLADLATGVPA
jgi:hypothetical protein